MKRREFIQLSTAALAAAAIPAIADKGTDLEVPGVQEGDYTMVVYFKGINAGDAWQRLERNITVPRNGCIDIPLPAPFILGSLELYENPAK